MTEPAQHADYVAVSRAALLDLIEDVKAIARVTGPDGSMVYCRLMGKVHAVEITMTDASEGGSDR